MVVATQFRAPLLGLFSLVALMPACFKSTSSETQNPDTAKREAPKRSEGPHAPAMPGENVPSIKIDTVGYPTSWNKVAVFNIDPIGATLQDESGAVVFTVKKKHVEDRGLDKASQDYTWLVDFSEVKSPGTFHFVHNDAKSDPFKIGDNIYRDALDLGLKSFYFQRTRTKLEAPYAEHEGVVFGREGISHAHEDVGWDIETYPEKVKKWDVKAGWHDAGNYDMYVPSTAPTAQALLAAYEYQPDLFKDGDLNIPESQNKVPDILDEASWGIRWVLSMQEKDGGFRMRETVMTQDEVGAVPADQDKSVRWIDRVGSASTAKGCALAAATVRVYKNWDPTLAKQADKSAKKAWEWLLAHPQRVMVPATGAAKDNHWLLWDDGPGVESDVGARFIAAAEMWKTYRDPKALEMLRTLMDAPETSQWDFPYGAWQNLSRWGMITLAFDEKTPSELREEAKKRLIESAESMRRQVEKDGYLCASKPSSDYYWGHNSNLLEKAQLFYTAYQLDNSLTWARQAAREQWHWIMGRNPNGFSMVTHVGKGPLAFYHAEWGPRYPDVPPGFLVGGPNFDNMKFLSPDAPAKALLWDNPEALESGVPAHGLWHWDQKDLWAGGFLPEGSWDEGWWGAVEGDIFYNGNLALVATYMVADSK